MIKLPREISKVFKTLEDQGYKVYAVGGCVRDSLLGEKPLDWDLATDATLEVLKEIFPEGKVISEKYGVIRLDHTAGEAGEEGIIVDIARFRTEGPYSDGRRPDYVRFVKSMKEDLARRDFTINAMADNPAGAMLDPYDGRKDLQDKLIRTVGHPEERFRENPIRMLRAVRLAAEYDFDLHKSVFDAMVKTGEELEKAGPDRIREEFERIITAPYAGKGLRMLEGANLMGGIVGRENMTLGRRALEDFHGLCDNIHKTQPIADRRLGLFYICFGRKKGLAAMARLNYPKDTQQHLTDALTMMEDFYFLRTYINIKSFLVKYGYDRYGYLDNLCKAQRAVYDYSEHRILARYEMLREIQMNHDPIFIEDLAVTGEDIIKAGIAEGPKVGQLLMMLTDVVHRKPDRNKKDLLLEDARRFSKNKLAAKTRKVNWLK